MNTRKKLNNQLYIFSIYMKRCGNEKLMDDLCVSRPQNKIDDKIY